MVKIHILSDDEWDSLEKIPDPMWPERYPEKWVYKHPGEAILKEMGCWVEV